jgi:thioester reductase-like protein
VKAAERGLQTTSFRIGQITGGYANGAWATSDWVPILVKSSIVLGCLPDSYGLASWTPFDAVARTILDVAALSAERIPERALNVVHPHPVRWSKIMEELASALVQAGVVNERLPAVPYGDWYIKLQAVAEGASEVIINRIVSCRTFFSDSLSIDA